MKQKSKVLRTHFKNFFNPGTLCEAVSRCGVKILPLIQKCAKRNPNSYSAAGDHHHFLWLRPESEVEVLLPIAIHLQQGTVSATLQLSTQE